MNLPQINKTASFMKKFSVFTQVMETNVVALTPERREAAGSNVIDPLTN